MLCFGCGKRDASVKKYRCGHSYCQKCMADRIDNRAAKSKGSAMVNKCLMPHCFHIFHYDEMERALSKERLEEYTNNQEHPKDADVLSPISR